VEKMMEEMKKYGIKFDIAGESNYLPGRKFQVRFRKIIKIGYNSPSVSVASFFLVN
jgi:hypothetical protein